jgi:hypothetical protein
MSRLLVLAGVWLLGNGILAGGQNSTVPTSQVTAFMGTWTFAMTNPPNSEQTVKIWDKQGVVAATFQVGKFPPNDITGVLKDGDMLVLTTTVRENGAPIWAVIALTLDGDTMSMAQMLQRSETIKRGTAKKQVGL